MDLSKYTSVRPREGSPSPWDRIDGTDLIVPGIVQVYTPGHGGVWLSREWIAKLPEPVLTWCFAKQRAGHYTYGPQWFEEDCAWSIPFAFLPAEELRAAAKLEGSESGLEARLTDAPSVVRCWWPDLAALLPAAPETPAEVWREVPMGKTFTRAEVRALVVADGYAPQHVDRYLDACARPDAGFLVVGKRTDSTPAPGRRYFERVQP